MQVLCLNKIFAFGSYFPFFQAENFQCSHTPYINLTLKIFHNLQCSFVNPNLVKTDLSSAQHFFKPLLEIIAMIWFLVESTFFFLSVCTFWVIVFIIIYCAIYLLHLHAETVLSTLIRIFPLMFMCAHFYVVFPWFIASLFIINVQCNIYSDNLINNLRSVQTIMELSEAYEEFFVLFSSPHFPAIECYITWSALPS